jgi:hypothetical protein
MSLAQENQIYRYAERAERERRKAMPTTTTPPTTTQQGTCDHEHDVKHDVSFLLFADNVEQERRENGIY